MEPVVCKSCGTPMSIKYPQYVLMYKDVQNKTRELWLKTLSELNIINDCCKMEFLCTMTRQDMINNVLENTIPPEIQKILDKYDTIKDNL
jgi:DNA-directed RNA polymerase subunit N (RpoN/RPB10)